jgi:hypothetical protein
MYSEIQLIFKLLHTWHNDITLYRQVCTAASVMGKQDIFEMDSLKMQFVRVRKLMGIIVY